MELDNKLKQILDKLYTETGASFSGIFRENEEEIVRTVYPEKEKYLSELIKLIIERGHQTNEIIEDFGEEYIYAEGKDISIFVIFVTPEISIASIIEGDIKFALLKLVHIAAAKKIRELYMGSDKEEKLPEGSEPQKITEPSKPIASSETPSILETSSVLERNNLEHTEETIEIVPLEKEIPELEDEKTEITVADVRDKFIEDIEEIEKAQEEKQTEDIPELENVLSTPSEEKEEEKNTTKKEETIEEDIPSLEEILGVDELQHQEEQKEENKEKVEETEEVADKEEEKEEEEKEMEPILPPVEEYEYFDPSVLEKVREALVMEIGPIGNFLFKKRLKELNIDPEKITQKQLDNLIKKLLTDIIDTKRKENFIKKTSKFL